MTSFAFPSHESRSTAPELQAEPNSFSLVALSGHTGIEVKLDKSRREVYKLRKPQKPWRDDMEKAMKGRVAVTWRAREGDPRLEGPLAKER
jgi:hypothetical protein